MLRIKLQLKLSKQGHCQLVRPSKTFICMDRGALCGTTEAIVSVTWIDNSHALNVGKYRRF